MTDQDRGGASREAGRAVTTAAAGMDGPAGQAAEPSHDLTRGLARFIVSARFEDLPETVRHEGARTLLNWVGCAIGGARHETMTIAMAALSPFFGPAQATLFGRPERVDVLHGALLNGIASHVLDFDDTHIETAIHPAAPVAPAILALAEHRSVSGRDLMAALIIGVETELRIGMAVTPAHYRLGWHITGTAGAFGSAAAAGKLLGLSEQQMCRALGLAAAQPVGLQEMFGSMTKSFHPGRAAQNGLTAALLAHRGFTASEQALEAKRGWLNVLSPAYNTAAITDPGWEILNNSYKPFACGLVVHPVIDGCLRLRNENGLTPDMIERVELAVHPRVMDVTSIKDPKTGLEGKFSVYHAAAVALVAGAAGEQQFSDETVRAPAIAQLRRRVSVAIEPDLGKAQARVGILRKKGERLAVFVEHAIGSVQNPMSDRMLEDKFRGLSAGILPAGQTDRLVALCWGAAKLADAGEIARHAASA
ncbi:MAG TPA: MmgE/PrpD family protein [Xanthobacteraceae bacterium]|jgi:2-methylcitrate dehydratase PrpD